MSLKDKTTDLGLTYLEALHGMQSAVLFKMNNKTDIPPENRETSPKHLRVGVNSAMIETSALVSLLVDKGFFTLAEYLEYLRLNMNQELAEYQKELGASFR